MLVGAASSATPQPSTVQPTFPKLSNPSANLPSNSTFTPANPSQPMTVVQQAPETGSVPRQPQAQALRVNRPESATQVALFAE